MLPVEALRWRLRTAALQVPAGAYLLRVGLRRQVRVAMCWCPVALLSAGLVVLCASLLGLRLLVLARHCLLAAMALRPCTGAVVAMAGAQLQLPLVAAHLVLVDWRLL